MDKQQELEMKQAIDQRIVTVKCDTCGHKFDSDPYVWVWDGDAMGSLVPFPPECPVCNGIKTNLDMPDGEFSAMCKTFGIDLLSE